MSEIVRLKIDKKEFRRKKRDFYAANQANFGEIANRMIENKMSVGTLIESNAKEYTDFIAVKFEGKQVTYKEFNEWVNRYAHYFISIGVWGNPYSYFSLILLHWHLHASCVESIVCCYSLSAILPKAIAANNRSIDRPPQNAVVKTSLTESIPRSPSPNPKSTNPGDIPRAVRPAIKAPSRPTIVQVKDAIFIVTSLDIARSPM